MPFGTDERPDGRTRAPGAGSIVAAWLPLLFLVGLVVPPLLLLLVAVRFLPFDLRPRFSPAGAACVAPFVRPLPPAPPRSPPV